MFLEIVKCLCADLQVNWIILWVKSQSIDMTKQSQQGNNILPMNFNNKNGLHPETWKTLHF